MFHYLKIPCFTCTFLTKFTYNEYIGTYFLSHVVLRFSPSHLPEVEDICNLNYRRDMFGSDWVTLLLELWMFQKTRCSSHSDVLWLSTSLFILGRCNSVWTILNFSGIHHRDQTKKSTNISNHFMFRTPWLEYIGEWILQFALVMQLCPNDSPPAPRGTWEGIVYGIS